MLGKFWKKREYYYNIFPIRKENEKIKIKIKMEEIKRGPSIN
jgi:hypothetical protein